MDDSTSQSGTVRNADGQKAGHLLPQLYDELRKLAAYQLAQQPPGQTLQPTALVHEAWLRLVRTGDQTWQNQGHFFVAAAEAMRRILVENARRKSRLKRGGNQKPLDIDELELAGATTEDRVLLVDEALQRLQAEDPDTAQVVILKFFGGLTNRELAETLGVTERTVERDWAFARAWLYRVIRKEL
jgi:RNA polymerase sigma factor (TIGR02999 family)